MGLFSKKSFVGIDLGSHTIKAAQIERVGNTWKVTKTGYMLTPPDAIKDGVVIDPQSVTAALKHLMKEAHINATSANIAVAGGAVFVRPVRMPKMPEATLRKSIKFEAGRYVPGSAEDSYVEFDIIGPADDTQMDVLIVAAPKDIVQSRVAACEAAGIEVEAVDIEAFAMYRSLVEADQEHDWSQSTIALVDIGSSRTNISVIANGAFSMTRSIPQGGQTLTDALKGYFKLDATDAEAGKAQLDVRELLTEGGPKENPPLRVLQPHLDDLVREIRRSLNYYQSQQSEAAKTKAVDLLLFTGGGSKMPGLVEYMSHKLSITASSAGVFDNPRFVNSGGPQETGLDLAVASGLAMRAHAKAA